MSIPKPLPGYCGCTAQCERVVPPLKTGLNCYMPLTERTLPIQSRPAEKTGVPSPIRAYFLPKRHAGYTTYTAGTEDSFVKTAADVPPRQKEHGGSTCTVVLPKFDATSEKIATSTIAKHDPDFFSRVRKIEREDDDVRRNLTISKSRSGAAHNLRTVDINRKRATDTVMFPPIEEFLRTEKRRPNVTVKNDGFSENVIKLYGETPPSCNQQDFGDPTQRVPPSTADPRDLIKKSASYDLFGGTSKARQDIALGFTCHVPASPRNVSRVHGARDMLRQHAKCSVRICCKPRMPGYTGYVPDRAAPLNLASHTATCKNFFDTQMVNSTAELGMRRPEGNGRQNAVRGFFSEGLSTQDSLLADQYCVRFRPLEGLMKMGEPQTRLWISEVDLRRPTLN